MTVSSKKVLRYFLALLLLSAVKVALYPLYEKVSENGGTFLFFLYYFLKLFSSCVPFLPVGAFAAVSAKSSFGKRPYFSLIFLFLFCYFIADFGVAVLANQGDAFTVILLQALFSFLNNLISVAFLAVICILGFLLFLQKGYRKPQPGFFSFDDPYSRFLLLVSGVFTGAAFLYRLTDIIRYVSKRLGVVSTGDLVDFLFTLLFTLFAGFLSFTVSKVAFTRISAEK